VKLKAELEADVRKVTCDLDHLDACIRLFDPQADTRAVKRYATKHRPDAPVRAGQAQGGYRADHVAGYRGGMGSGSGPERRRRYTRHYPEAGWRVPDSFAAG
jgi:hypothetical protein